MAKTKNRYAAAFNADPLAPTVSTSPSRTPRPARIGAPQGESKVASPKQVTKATLMHKASTAGRRLTATSSLGPRGYAAGGRPPAPDVANVRPVRFTAYLTPDQYERLRTEVQRRQGEGKRADLSALLREAVEHTFGHDGNTGR